MQQEEPQHQEGHHHHHHHQPDEEEEPSQPQQLAIEQALPRPLQEHAQFKFTVAYNGYRFNGFQKQPSQQHSQSCGSALRPPPKRPHWESGGTGRTKRVPNTIQDCLEQAILQYIQHTLESKEEEGEGGKGKNKKTRKSDPCSNPISPPPSFSLDDLMFAFAGRTDKGVHALGQVVTCRIPLKVLTSTATTTTKTTTTTTRRQDPLVSSCLQDLMQGINSRLPVDISLSHIEGPLLATPPLDPRHDAIGKQYSYTLKYHRARPTSNDSGSDRGGGVHTMRNALLDSPCLWLVPWPLCDDIFPTLCQALSGTHDYTLFAHKEARDMYQHHILTVELQFQVIESSHSTNTGTRRNGVGDEGFGEVVTAKFWARSKGFRRTMVRNLVGFCVRMATRKDWTEQTTAAGGATPQMSRSTRQTTSTAATMTTTATLVGPEPLVAEESVLSNTSNNDEDDTAWKQQVVPYQHLIEAAPASGLCLDYVEYG